ncbi:flagellar basal body-associated FliL family protein [Conexibacter sp. SYSU D00693]|uniref:flagellar basal body-associated FliL family protein n=1 Tax=Conexibacter sp. SYSU D00693 TaxID=2812560 RepID=UPI00196AB3C7|nr:flagellar basal body-associated FliL family protein [Conexibacter sp. SYSU D00693]
MKKILMLVPVLLLVGGGGYYKMVVAKAAPPPKPKVEGEVYVLPKDFMINLAGGRYAKLGVGLVFHHGYTAAPAGGAHGSAAPAKPPEGYGLLPQEAIVRAIVTDVITGVEREELETKKGRKHLQHEVLERIEKTTDVKVEDVLFTDVAVQ